MALLRVVGVRDRASEDAVLAALRACDPEAAIRPDWTQGVIEVESARSAAELCEAIMGAGFIAAPMKRRPNLASGGDIWRLVGRTVLFAFLAGVGGVIAGAAAGILNLLVNPECHSGGDEGACAMGIPTMAVLAAFLGAVIAAGITLARGAWRLHRAR